MIDFKTLRVGDYLRVEYATGKRMRGGQIQGQLTRIWTPQEHCAHCWQGQIANGWCFHAEDILLEHTPSDVEETDHCKGRLVRGVSTLGWTPIWLVDEHGCVLHTEPVCSVPDHWHEWFVKWIIESDLPQKFPSLLHHPLMEKSHYVEVWCPQCKARCRIYEGELSKNDFPMCEKCFLPMKIKAMRAR